MMTFAINADGNLTGAAFDFLHMVWPTSFQINQAEDLVVVTGEENQMSKITVFERDVNSGGLVMPLASLSLPDHAVSGFQSAIWDDDIKS
jgi:6-phosphogluconolactonase (cycloisomerase 2 family)